MKKYIFRSFQSPGDILMLTAAVRDLHAAYPNQFLTDVRTSANELWLNNPHITRLNRKQSDVECLDMHYPLIHESNQRPYHFLHGYAQYLEKQLKLQIPVTRFRGDIHLSEQEKSSEILTRFDLPDRFWIVIAGGKYDFTAKWWNPAHFQKVMDYFQGKISFVQCGEQGHWHPPLEGVINLVGKTTLRDFVRLTYHADGVLCPVTFAMHLAAAVDPKPGKPKLRPCVVVAGGREPPHWEAYPHHQFISNVGTLTCCAEGGCWKSRCQLVNDGDEKDTNNVCEKPIQVSPDLRVAECMQIISWEDVTRRIDSYYRVGGIYQPMLEQYPITNASVRSPQKISVSFNHGLGDCAHFAHLIPLYIKRGFNVEVESPPNKRILFEAAGATFLQSKALHQHEWRYPPEGTHVGHGRFWQGSKIGHNISEPPLPYIGTKEDLWEEYCSSTVDVFRCVPDQVVETVNGWLAPLPRPIILLHTKGIQAKQRRAFRMKSLLPFTRHCLINLTGRLFYWTGITEFPVCRLIASATSKSLVLAQQSICLPSTRSPICLLV